MLSGGKETYCVHLSIGKYNTPKRKMFLCTLKVVALWHITMRLVHWVGTSPLFRLVYLQDVSFTPFKLMRCPFTS